LGISSSAVRLKRPTRQSIACLRIYTTHISRGAGRFAVELELKYSVLRSQGTFMVGPAVEVEACDASLLYAEAKSETRKASLGSSSGRSLGSGLRSDSRAG
jgi:hypothetical protein